MSPKVPNAQSPPRKSEIPSGSFNPRQNERALLRSLRCSSILIGGLVGSGIAAAGLEVLKWNGIVNKVLVPMVVAPLVGLTLAFLLAVGIMRAFRRRSPGRVNRGFAKVPLGSSFFASLMHGANDGQKFIGLMTTLLFGAGWLAWVATGVLVAFVNMEGLKRLIPLHEKRRTHPESVETAAVAGGGVP